MIVHQRLLSLKVKKLILIAHIQVIKYCLLIYLVRVYYKSYIFINLFIQHLNIPHCVFNPKIHCSFCF